MRACIYNIRTLYNTLTSVKRMVMHIIYKYNIDRALYTALNKHDIRWHVCWPYVRTYIAHKPPERVICVCTHGDWHQPYIYEHITTIKAASPPTLRIQLYRLGANEREGGFWCWWYSMRSWVQRGISMQCRPVMTAHRAASASARWQALYGAPKQSVRHSVGHP